MERPCGHLAGVGMCGQLDRETMDSQNHLDKWTVIKQQPTVEDMRKGLNHRAQVKGADGSHFTGAVP